jgi:lipoprotein signal peptidase
MSLDTIAVSASSSHASQAHVGRKEQLGQRSTVLALMAALIILDQATKYWAWRNASRPLINTGGNPFVGATVDSWCKARVTGALLDLVAFAVLGIALSALARRKRPALVLIPGIMMIGGWSSNLIDRLGLHHWTAPGSARGAVDFIHLGPHTWNVADFFIIVGTSLFLLVVSCLGIAARTGQARTGSVADIHYQIAPRSNTPAIGRKLISGSASP